MMRWGWVVAYSRTEGASELAVWAAVFIVDGMMLLPAIVQWIRDGESIFFVFSGVARN